MGYKANINTAMWGYPDDYTWLNSASSGLYAPRKLSWLGGNTGQQELSYYNNFRTLMYQKDLPPTIDESICAWGINKKSGVGARYLISGYTANGVTTPILVPTAESTAKGQKPAYITFNTPDAAYSDLLQSPFADTFGYFESKKSEFTSSYPTKMEGYSFIANINLKNFFVLPIVIATDTTASVAIVGSDYSSSSPFYERYPHQPQFTVSEYFTGTDSQGVSYTEKFPYVLGVYAGIFYRTQAGEVIPNLNILVQSKASQAVLTQYPVLDTGLTHYMTSPDYNSRKGTGNSAKVPRDLPTYLCVLGHNSSQNTSWITSSTAYPIANKISSEVDAISKAFTQSSSRYYYSYILPKELDSKLKTGVAVSFLQSEKTCVAWYEGLTEDDIYRQISYLGIPFYAGESTIAEIVNFITNNDFTTDSFRQTIMYPNFSPNMVTTGTYSPYASSDSPLKDTEWLFDIQQDYDPNYVQEGDESGDDYEKKQSDKGALQTTYHSNASMDGFTAYVLTGKGLETTKSIINSALVPPTDVSVDDWINTDWYGQDPASFILAVNRFPCDIQQVGASKMMTLGRTRLMTGDTPLYAATPSSQVQKLDFGSLQIVPYYNNFLDYAPYSTYTIHIPYLSDYVLDPKIWLGHSCSVKVDYDVVSCSAMAEIWRDDMWYDTVYGTFGTPVPFLVYNTGSYQNAVVSAQASLESAKSGMAQSVLSTASSVISTGVGVATGSAPLAIGSGLSLVNSVTQPFDAYQRVQNAEYNLKHIAPTPTSTSGTGGVTTLTTRNFCTLIISRPQPLHYDKSMYGRTVGFACCETGRLSSYHGLTVCSSTKLSTFTGTKLELSEIQSLLSSGVILP